MTNANTGLSVANYRLDGLSKINVILGKNGCGKSTLLRSLDQNLRGQGYVRYITPERGGQLSFDGGIETNLSNHANWGDSVRRQNRADNFRQLSMAEFRRLENLVLRKIEKDPSVRQDLSFSFDITVNEINELLDNARIVRSATSAFETRAKESDTPRTPQELSSGESELISLAIEILSYAYVADSEEYKTRHNYLLIDEPDVHLHPDLQHRLMRLLVNAAVKQPYFTVIIATHSTAIVSALGELGAVNLAMMRPQAKSLEFKPATEELKAVLPIFGAHPLSNVFNAKPILLVEGEDDRRIWEQAVRSANGRIKIWPCPAGDVQSLQRYEQAAANVIEAVYDRAIAFSLRDRDDDEYNIDDLNPVKRARLNCRSAENLLVSDDVLSALGSSWETFQKEFEDWLSTYRNHPQFAEAHKFKEQGYDRRNARLKPLRNLIMMLAGSDKPWEVAVGQSIAAISPISSNLTNSLADYLGPKAMEMLGLAAK